MAGEILHNTGISYRFSIRSSMCARRFHLLLLVQSFLKGYFRSIVARGVVASARGFVTLMGVIKIK